MRFFFGWVPRNPWLGFLLALGIGVAALIPGSTIPVRLSLMDLLPENRESVRNTKEIAKEVGGIGYLLVIVGPTNSPQQYMPLLAQEFNNHPELRFTYFERESYILRHRAPYLIPEKKFNAFFEHAEALAFKGKSGGALDLGLGDRSEEEERTQEAKKFFEDFKKDFLPLSQGTKKPGEDSELATAKQRYYLSKDGRYAAFWMKPNFDVDLLTRSEALIQDVESRAKKVLPEGTPFKLWGRYFNHVRDVRQIRGDMMLTGVVSTVLMVVILLFGMGSFRSAFFSVFCVVISMGWTLGFARLVVGQINIITGFLLAILAGLGVEYGVHLIRRYFQERAAHHTRHQAFETSYWNTGATLFSAALTSAGAFLVLYISDFRAFSELGIIASFGIVAIYLVYMLCYPLLVQWLPEKPRFSGGIRFFAIYPFGKKWLWILPVVLGAVGYGLSRARFEYNFQKMRELSSETLRANDVMNDIMSNRTTTPLPVLAVDTAQALKAQEWLEDPARAKTIHSALSLGNLLPLNMKERELRLKSFAKKLGHVSDKKIQEVMGLDPQLVRTWMKAKPYTREDLPPQLRDAFGRAGNVILVYSRASISSFDGIKEIVGTLLEAARNYPGLKVGGDTRIFKEILDHVFSDGYEVMLLFFLGTFFLQFLEFRKLRDSVELELQLVLGVLFLVGLMGLFNVPFTIVNIGMLPAVLACGIDIGVHVRHRDKEVSGSPLSSARFVAQAVQLSVVTTLVGFASLFLAQAAMLKGIAWISVLGQCSMYFICMFVWPLGRSVLTGRSRGKKPQRI